MKDGIHLKIWWLSIVWQTNRRFVVRVIFEFRYFVFQSKNYLNNNQIIIIIIITNK